MAHRRHKRDPDARPRPNPAGSRATRLAAGVAVAATLPAVAVGVYVAGSHAPSLASARGSADIGRAGSGLTADRAAAPLSRSFDRAAHDRFQRGASAANATARAVRTAHTTRWTTTTLNLWSSASSAAREVGQLAASHRVLVTGRTADGRVELALHGLSRWVTAGYLATKKPVATTSATGAVGAAAGLSMAPCPNSAVEHGLTAGAIYVYRSVCHAFPQITTYGGWSPSGEHASGKAIDIMTTDVALGTAIADFLQAHAAELNLYDVIWRQHIWTPVRAAEGWRLMPDRGSITANHYNHVHVSVN